jgi:hypothetical protein
MKEGGKLVQREGCCKWEVADQEKKGRSSKQVRKRVRSSDKQTAANEVHVDRQRRARNRFTCGSGMS